jgi:hypothetical protein
MRSTVSSFAWHAVHRSARTVELLVLELSTDLALGAARRSHMLC